MSTERGLRYNTNKLKWSLVDFKSLEPMVKVLEFGATKYAKDNWKKGMPVSEVMESLLRHCFAMLAGEEIDPESGEQHIGHIQCNAMFISYMMNEKRQFNDITKIEDDETIS